MNELLEQGVKVFQTALLSRGIVTDFVVKHKLVHDLSAKKVEGWINTFSVYTSMSHRPPDVVDRSALGEQGLTQGHT